MVSDRKKITDVDASTMYAFVCIHAYAYVCVCL